MSTEDRRTVLDWLGERIVGAVEGLMEDAIGHSIVCALGAAGLTCVAALLRSPESAPPGGWHETPAVQVRASVRVSGWGGK